MVAADVMKFRADLRRVAYWLLQGSRSSVETTVGLAREKYDLSGLRPGGREMDWWWKELAGEDKRRAAERALTLSMLLGQEKA